MSQTLSGDVMVLSERMAPSNVWIFFLSPQENNRLQADTQTLHPPQHFLHEISFLILVPIPAPTHIPDGWKSFLFFCFVFFLKERFASSSGNFPSQAMHWICVQMWDMQAMHHSCSFTSKSKEVYLHFHHIKIPPVLPLLHTTVHCACPSPPVLSTRQTTVKARETFKNFFFLFFFSLIVCLS